MQRQIIIALDFSTMDEMTAFIEQFPNEKLFVKVGMELFYQQGPKIVTILKEQGHSIFLDLKLHDIPTTVKNAMRGLARLGVDIVNVHAAGGSKMMESAIEGLDAGTLAGQKRPTCIAVTQLTSTSENVMRNELLINKPLEETVLHYASLSQKSGLDGVVCSTLEVQKIHEHLGEDFITVTPGIRLASGKKDDQVRVATPSEARALGATAIVVGRSITVAKNPFEAYVKVKSLWEGESR